MSGRSARTRTAYPFQHSQSARGTPRSRFRVRPLLDVLEDRCLLSFGSPWLSNTGASNAAVAVGDVTGDGMADLVTATTAGGITIAPGNGDGSFGTLQSIAPFASSLSGLTLASVDGSGRLDIIAADPAENEVWVLLNQGNGTFGAPVAYSTGTGSAPQAVAVANLGNGQNDIITANSGNNTVSVLVGHGNGTFHPHQDYGTGVDPVALAIGDLNNDGKLDLVTANTLGNSVSVLRGNGDGTLRPTLDVPITVVVDSLVSTVSRPVGVALGDFNGDGRLDLVTANSATASVTVALGNGDGSFGIQQNVPVDTKTSLKDNPSAVVAADLDGDGKVSIAFTEPKRGAIGVLPGNGDGTFATQVDYVASANPTAMAVGNFNGDLTSLGNPRLDLATVDPSDAQAAVLLGLKYSTATSFKLNTTTTTYGSPVTLTFTVSTGIVPQDVSTSGTCQVYVDGQAFGNPVNLNSTGTTPNNLAAGIHKVVVVYTGNDDLQPSTSVATTLIVSPAKLAVTAVSQSRTYGDVNPAFTYRITGFVGSDFLDQSLLSGTPVFTTTVAGPASPVGNYAINIAPGSLAYANANYILDPTLYQGGMLTVLPAPLTIALNLPPTSLTRPMARPIRT